MRKFYFLGIAIIAVILSACGDGSTTLTPTSTKITGPLGNFFEIVERSYKLQEDGKLNVEFKRINEGGPEGASWDSEPTFSVELIDEEGNTIANDDTNVVIDEKQLEAVFNLSMDETASISFKFDTTKGAVKFKVLSKWDKEKENSTSSTSGVSEFSLDDDWTETSSSSTSNEDYSENISSSESGDSSEDWNAVLASYDEYVTKYISYMKRAKNGDMNALSEYPELLEKSEEFSSKLEKAKNDMTPAQWSRYMKITNKLASAAANL